MSSLRKYCPTIVLFYHANESMTSCATFVEEKRPMGEEMTWKRGKKLYLRHESKDNDNDCHDGVRRSGAWPVDSDEERQPDGIGCQVA